MHISQRDVLNGVDTQTIVPVVVKAAVDNGDAAADKISICAVVVIPAASSSRAIPMTRRINPLPAAQIGSPSLVVACGHVYQCDVSSRVDAQAARTLVAVEGTGNNLNGTAARATPDSAFPVSRAVVEICPQIAIVASGDVH